MEKKYRTEPEGDMLRIIALKDFHDVKKGEKGGLIEREDNLSQEGICWVYGNAKVYGDATVSGSAMVCGASEVYGMARIYGYASVYGNARICGNVTMGSSMVCGNVKLWSTELSYIYTPKSNTKDYVILATRLERGFEFCILSSYADPTKTVLPISGQDYIKNIETIRQIYEKEI